MNSPLNEHQPILDHRIVFDSDRYLLKDMFKLKKRKYVQIMVLRKQAIVNKKGELQTGIALIVQHLN